MSLQLRMCGLLRTSVGSWKDTWCCCLEVTSFVEASAADTRLLQALQQDGAWAGPACVLAPESKQNPRVLAAHVTNHLAKENQDCWCLQLGWSWKEPEYGGLVME